MRAVEQDERDVAEVVERYRLGFATLDVATLTAIWDQSYGKLIYVPLEVADALRGWESIEQYYHQVAGVVRAQLMTVSDLSVDVIGDLAYAFCTFHFEGEISGNKHTADGRSTFILRRKDGSWKVIHYHESGAGL